MFNRRKDAVEVPMEDTAIWLCADNECKGWMRDNFSFDEEPTCRLCSGPMERGMKMLPVLDNGGLG